MSSPRTLFIVGAGASFDFDFPVGKVLQDEIAEFLRPSDSYDEGINPSILVAMDQIQKKGMSFQTLHKHCEWMANTLPLFPSIDTFLDKQSDPDDATSYLGKLAIASIIALREERSSLVLRRNALQDWTSLSKTWLGRLWALTNVGGSKNPNQNPMPGVSFITFNYDRCIQQFITLAISQSHRINFKETLAVSKSIACEHVYGSLGDISSYATNSAFGSCKFASQHAELAGRIKTFTEQVDSEAHSRMTKLIKEANSIVVLGFSFGRINQIFLESVSDNESSLKGVMGTSFGMSPEDAEIAKNWSDNCFRKGHSGTKLQPLSAADFFENNNLLFQNQ